VNVTLIDYGAGNVASVERALRRLGVETVASNSPEAIRRAERLILPGVGHCAALLSSLDANQLRQPLLDAIQRGVPFLGICLGLQALYDSSDEAPDLRGLGFFPGRVTRLPPTVKLPHMGWNQLRLRRSTCLLRSIAPDSFFYFAHSYAAPAAGPEIVAAGEHGCEFAAVIERGNIAGVQFHPEKSGIPGAQLLSNFLGRPA